MGCRLRHLPPHLRLHQPHRHERGSGKVERGHLPLHPAPYLADRLRDGPPLPAPTWSAPSPATRARSTTWPSWATIRSAWPTSAPTPATPSTVFPSCTARSSRTASSTIIILYKPKAFTNVTNGIAYRRWLLASNPGLTNLLDRRHRRRLQAGCLQPEKAGEVCQTTPLSWSSLGKVKRREQGHLCRLSAQGYRPGDRPRLHL